MEEEGRERGGGGEREEEGGGGGGGREIKMQIVILCHSLPVAMAIRKHTQARSTAMKKARGNSCCQFSESYTDGLTHSGESGYWHIQPIQWVHTP